MLGWKYASAGLKYVRSLEQVTRGGEHFQNHSVIWGPIYFGMQGSRSYKIYECIVMLNKTIQ
jgi:hypothetical protein